MPEGLAHLAAPSPCHRWLGLSCQDCACRRPDGTWSQCPPEARRRLPKIDEHPALWHAVWRAYPKPPPPPPAPKRFNGLSGDVCDVCGGTNLHWAGTCRLCHDCGSTSAGCS